MQPEAGHKDAGQALQMVAWLDEERRRDKAEVQKLQQTVEQVNARHREVIGRLEIAEAEVRQLRGQAGRAGQTDEALRQLREWIAASQEWQEGHERAGVRATQAHAMEVERDRRAVADLQAQLANLTREGEVLKSRLLLLTDEVRRDTGALPAVQQEVLSFGKRWQGLSDRIDLVEEGQRHRDVRVVALGQQTERLSNEQNRFTEWQRLAEVRWSRQLAEWQQQIEEWRRQAEDGAREVAGTAKLLPAIKDEIGELRRHLAEERERGVARDGSMTQIAAQHEVDREVVPRLEQSIVGLAGRIDDLVAQLHQAADRLARAADQQQVLDERLRAERERVEAILRTLARMEERDFSSEGRLDQVASDVVGLHRQLQGRAEQLERNLADLARRIDLRLLELERLEAEHKQRAIAELEQQIKEMQERARQTKG